MADLGIIFNCRGDYYSLVAGEPNALAPGKRPRSTLQSTLVMKDGQPYMIMGSPGGDDQVMRTMQTLLNIVDFGLNVQQAIEVAALVDREFPRVPLSPHDEAGHVVGRVAHSRGQFRTRSRRRVTR